MHQRLKLRLAAVFDAQYGGFATGWSPVSWGSIDKLFVNLTMPSGCHRQSRVENTFFRDTSIIGDGLRARSPAGQGSEVVLGCAILNRMTELGRPVS